MLGWGPKDESTKDERDAWKNKAQSQMNGDDDDRDESTDDTPKHRRAYRPKW